jgi:Reverse transcriptase (RNA-dependent DNA polymerase)
MPLLSIFILSLVALATVTQSSCLSHGPVCFHDKSPQEHDEEACDHQTLLQQAGSETVEEGDASEEDEQPVEFVDAIEEAPPADSDSGEGKLAELLLINIDVVYYKHGLVGASLGGGFAYANELKPMKYKEAMASPDKKHWEVAVKEEKVCFDTTKAVEAKVCSELPPGTTVMDNTWACKKKSNGVFHAQLNLCSFCQVDGVHYDSHDISSPVANIITIHIILALIAILGWFASLVDVNGAFLLGDWEANREIYMEVPEGWEHHYPEGTVLKLLKWCMAASNALRDSESRCLLFWIQEWDSSG